MQALAPDIQARTYKHKEGGDTPHGNMLHVP